MTDVAGLSCILPGCTELAAEQGAAGHSCIDDWGPYLRAGAGPAMTAEEQGVRDSATRRAYAMQLAGNDPKLIAAVQARYADPPTSDGGGGGPFGKANQRCWLCEQRRTCTREEHGWECKACRRNVV